MNSNYPPGVTGNEPQIAGYGTEGLCDACLRRAEEETPLSAIPEAVIEYGGEWLCPEHFREAARESGVDLAELFGAEASVAAIIDRDATIGILREQIDLKNRLMHTIAEGLADALEQLKKLKETT